MDNESREAAIISHLRYDNDSLDSMASSSIKLLSLSSLVLLYQCLLRYKKPESSRESHVTGVVSGVVSKVCGSLFAASVPSLYIANRKGVEVHRQYQEREYGTRKIVETETTQDHNALT